MHDRYFKNLNHRCKGFSVIYTGQELVPGYKPDIVLQNEEKEELIILESETSTNRKAFLGGMLKAAYYLTEAKRGRLVFIMKEHSNATVKQITHHLKPYFVWIKPLTNLESIQIISDRDYCMHPENDPLILYESSFMKLSTQIR